MMQNSLFDTGPAGPPAQPVRTSIEAAERIAPVAKNLREVVFEFIESCGDRGATRQEISDGVPMRLQTVCGRCSELLGNQSKGWPKRIYQTDESRNGGKVLWVIPF